MSKRARHAGRETQLETTADEYYMQELADQVPARHWGISVLHEDVTRALLGYYHASNPCVSSALHLARRARSVTRALTTCIVSR